MARTPSSRTPSVVNDFLVLPLQMPPCPSFPKATTHYLYLRANAPKVPTVDTPREVFLVNIPIDSTEAHLRSLFANQLGGARIERVDFEGTRVGRGITAPVAPIERGKKRKRDEGLAAAHDALQSSEQQQQQQQQAALPEEVGVLPALWDRALHRSGSTAIATFVDKPSADAALRHTRKTIRSSTSIHWPDITATNTTRRPQERTAAIPPLGLTRYQTFHTARYPSHAILQASVDAYMTAFSAHELLRAQALARQRAEPDADGFITVTRGGSGGNSAARLDEAREKLAEQEKRERARIKDDFYRFQNREKKKLQAAALTQDFEEDRRRVAEMKARRRNGRVRPE